jgi:beta-glucanase (GH16 family)
MLLVSAMIAVFGCATTPPAAPSVNVSGAWSGTWSYENPSLGGGDLRGTFQQDGEKVSGRFDVTGPVVNRTANLAGTVSGNEVRLSQPASGSMTVSGNEMTGRINGLNVAKVTLRRQ